jgi:hypothetical protein
VVAFPSDCSLWELALSRTSNAEQVLDKTVVAGSDRTTVKHLINNYIPRNAPQPLNRLLVLAAHAILMGHRELPSDIDGLEIAIVRPTEKPRFLNAAQITQLENISAGIHTSLDGLLMSGFEF